MGPSDETRLESLTWSWGDAYAISNPEPGVWLAQRLDTRATLRADSAGELDTMILADYSARPVPRETGRPQ